MGRIAVYVPGRMARETRLQGWGAALSAPALFVCTGSRCDETGGGYPVIYIKDFYNPDTGHYDHSAYNAACVAAGEHCRECNGFISLHGKGTPATCRDC